MSRTGGKTTQHVRVRRLGFGSWVRVELGGGHCVLDDEELGGRDKDRRSWEVERKGKRQMVTMAWWKTKGSSACGIEEPDA